MHFSRDESVTQQLPRVAKPLSGLEEHILDYALALNEQINTLIRAYEEALARWKFERAALLASRDTAVRRDTYVEELEQELLAAWERLDGHEVVSPDSNVPSREVEIAIKSSAQREQRLVIELAQARRAEQAARTAAADLEAKLQAQADVTEAERRKAAAMAAERNKVVQRYQEAREQAQRIFKGIADLEAEMSNTIAAKDAELRQLMQRCAQLEQRTAK